MNERRSGFDVRVFAIQRYQGERGTTCGVRWPVAGQRLHRTFKAAKLADGFRAELLAAVRNGKPFDLTSGLPEVLTHERMPMTCLEYATAYTSAKWPLVSPDGTPASASTLARKRAVPHNARDAAVEAGHLDINLLRHLKLRRPPSVTTVDRRVARAAPDASLRPFHSGGAA